MTKIYKRVIVNPTLKNNEDIVCQLSLYEHKEIRAYRVYSVRDKITKEFTEYTFTHDLYRYCKPMQDYNFVQGYSAVCDPCPLGSGRFGDVHAVVGKWTFKTQGADFKTKADPYKQKAVKIAAKFGPKGVRRTDHVFFDEQDVGQHAPHMGLKYPPTLTEENLILFMRKHIGESLAELIEKSRKNKQYLSVTERIQLSINLLKQLHVQLHDVKIPIKNESLVAYIVHQDIKPDNIICEKKKLAQQNRINFIDLGLATPSNETPETLCGSAKWMDPHRYNTHSQSKPDKVSDLASLARIIAVLWGDVSRVGIVYDFVLKEANAHNRTTTLCEDINELSAEEAGEIKSTIKLMTSYEPEKRPSREDDLRQFELILERRLAFLKEKLKSPLKELSVDLLLELLKGPLADELIARYKEQTQDFPDLLNKIRPHLYQFDEQTLRSLHANGLKFSNLRITYSDLQHQAITAEQIPLLLELGSSLQPRLLKRWFECEKYFEKLPWAKMCRALYHASSYPNQRPVPKPGAKDFAALFYHHYLLKPDTAHDEETNVRLIEQHLTTVEQEEIKISRVRSKFDRMATTPLAQKFFASEFINIPQDDLLLAPRAHYLDLEIDMGMFLTLKDQIEALKSISGMTTRDEVIAKIKLDLSNRLSLIGYDLDRALFDINPLIDTLEQLKELDALYERLKIYITNKMLPAQFLSDLDSYYQNSYVDAVFDCVEYQVLAAEKNIILLQDINQTKLSLKQLGLANLVIETELDTLTKGFTLNNSSANLEKLLALKSTYTQLYEHIIELNKLLRSSDAGDSERKAIAAHYKKILIRAVKTQGCNELTQLMNTYNQYKLHEQVFYERINDSKTQRFIYSILMNHINPDDEHSIARLSHIMEASNRNHRVTAEFLQRIEGMRHKISSECRGHDGKERMREFKTSIWHYFSESAQPQTEISRYMHGFFQLPIYKDRTESNVSYSNFKR